ncbi:DUF1488 family protein [Sphingomonas bacterium]|uniref:DUF1488 family protein n=1 Tax=Sphingomonas bacterium TaxID=1895847 RepID=UPI001576FDC3|nr:DUF1488 family protein [Sphingomonas bacterium]
MTDRLDIDTASVFDNLDERQVEFAGEVDGELIRFAVRHDLLEALSGTRPDGDAVALFTRHADPIADAALAALGRDRGVELVVVSENDLA